MRGKLEGRENKKSNTKTKQKKIKRKMYTKSKRQKKVGGADDT